MVEKTELGVADRWAAQNVERMCRAGTEGMDVVIVSTGSASQAGYWQRRLEAGRGQVVREGAVVIAVHEDWPGGAGNGLGTLFAWEQACAIALARGNGDLSAMLRAGGAVAIYHTAGKGTRMAPLPGSECNNKPGVKLPGLLTLSGELTPVTILESVIRQTSVYAKSRAGRISVFWGDQVFVPSCDVEYTPQHHADIICCLGAMPDAGQWAERELEKYGLIAVGRNGAARQVEKISHAEATRLIEAGKLSVEGGIGTSMGSFSVSADLVEALMQEFAEELGSRQGKLDTDPHFWMPLTLDVETYLGVMAGKGTSVGTARAHYERMQLLASKLDGVSDGDVLGAVDIGEDAYWWDYGLLTGYRANVLRLLDTDAEAEAMRAFFGVRDRFAGSELGEVVIDDRSLVVGCCLTQGEVRNSVVIGVSGTRVSIENSVVINSAASGLCLAGALLYNAADSGEIELGAGEVRADAFLPPDVHHVMRTSMARDGKADWDSRVSGNPVSYAEMHAANVNVDPIDAEQMAVCARRDHCVGGSGDSDE